MRICVTGFYGWGNSGDEGILLSIIDQLGGDNEYIVCTSLPYTTLEEYLWKLPRISVDEVRQIYDIRTDYDAFLLGGGGLSWGYGWRQALAAFSAEKPSMVYAVGYSWKTLYNPRLHGLYKEFLKLFDAITVRDQRSKKLLESLGVEPTLTMCPSINLEEESFNCPEGMIAVCPRYEDYPRSNDPQVDWLVSRIKDVKDEVLLVPFGPYNKEGVGVDMALCKEVSRRLGGVRILETDGYSPRRVKYALSRSKLVISGGRYHALMWAAAHNVPYELYPLGSENYPKTGDFIEMHQKYGIDKLKDMGRMNKEIFQHVTE